MNSLIEIEGFPELAKAFASISPELSKEFRHGLKALAEPIAHSAEQFAVENISGISREKKSHWEAMRVGIAPGFSVVYVAPRERGLKTRGLDVRRRPRFADTLRDKAMDPAVVANEAGVIAGAELIVDEVTGRVF
jgi:hypothetical protein